MGRGFVVLALLALSALAGCTTAPGDTNSTTTSTDSPSCDTPTTAHCCPPGERWLAYGCTPPPFARLRIESSGRGVVASPFPHLDRCLDSTDWQTATPTSNQAEHSFRHVDVDDTSGDLVWGAFDAAGFVELRLNLTKAQCQTFRFDPWSIEPDPADGELWVFADRAGLNAVVHLEVGDGSGCWHHEEYAGLSRDGWVILHEVPNQTYTACV